MCKGRGELELQLECSGNTRLLGAAVLCFIYPPPEGQRRWCPLAEITSEVTPLSGLKPVGDEDLHELDCLFRLMSWQERSSSKGGLKRGMIV